MVPALAALLALPAAAQDMPATEFNVVGSIGTLSMQSGKELPFWTQQVPAETGGKIKASVKPFTELGFKGGEIFRLVSSGTLQMATTVLACNSGEVPRNESTDLVGLLTSFGQLADVIESWRPSYAAFLKKEHNLKLPGFCTYQAQVICCRDSLGDIADLKGRKVRASGASQQAFVSHLGGSPLTIAFAETQAALASGVVDCAITGALSGYRRNGTKAPSSSRRCRSTSGWRRSLANLDWWNGLDGSVQDYLTKALRELETSIFEQAATETATGLACNTTGPCPEGAPAGMTLEPLTDADDALRTAAVKAAILPSFAARCGADCVRERNAGIGAKLGILIE